MDENQKIIYDLLTEVRRDQKKDSEKIAETQVCVTEVRNKLELVEQHVDRNAESLKNNTASLDEHIARTEVAEKSLEILKELHKDNQKRIEMLEEKRVESDRALAELGFEKRARTWLKENFKYWLAIAGLAATLISKMAGLW